jgi:hypothetical protein
MPKLNLFKILVFVFCFTIIIGRAMTLPVDDKSGSRSNIIGDRYSEYNLMSAVRYFYDFGFWESKLRPIHGYKGDVAQKDRSVVYLHYPAMPDILSGVTAKVFGTTDERALRLFPILISMFIFWFIYWFMSQLYGPRVGFVSGTAFFLSQVFFIWADNLHQHVYFEFAKWMLVFGLFKYYFTKRSAPLLGALFLLCLFMSHISFEFYVWAAACVVGFSIANEKGFKKIISKETVLLGTAFVLGFAIHIYLNNLYLGSWDAAITDLKDSFLHRTGTVCEEGVQCGLSIADRLSFPVKALNRIERFYIIPGYAMIFLGFLALKRLRTERKDIYKLCLITLASSFSWYIFMPQHALNHSLVARHASVFFTLTVGLGLFEYWKVLKSHWQGPDTYKKFLHASFILYIVAMMLTQQVARYWWEHGLSVLWRS